MRLEIYRPRRKIEIRKEEAVPFLIRAGGYFMAAGGFVAFCLSSTIFGVKSFFHMKEKIYNTAHPKRYVEIRIKKRR